MKTVRVISHTRNKPERPLAFYWKTMELRRAQQADFERRLKECEYLADELAAALKDMTRDDIARMLETY